MIENAAWYEVVWTLVSGVGFVVTVYLLREAARDRRALLAAGRNGPGKLLASGLIRAEAFRCGKLALMALIGVVAMVAPPPVEPARTIVAGLTLRFVISIGLVVVSAVITLNAVLDHRMRRRVDAAILKVYAADGVYLDPPRTDQEKLP